MWSSNSLSDSDLDLYDELLRLTRGAGAIRLELADGLDQLEAMNGITKLGYPSLDAYGRERLGYTGRWLGDLRTLNQRLAGLPILRAAYVTGLVASSKVELLARHLTRSGEVDEDAQRRALALAEALGVRELRKALGTSEPTDIGPAPTVQITRAVSRLDAALFEGTIRLMNALGATTRRDAVEAMLAEGMVTLLDLVPRESEVRAGLLERWVGAPSSDEDGPMSGDEGQGADKSDAGPMPGQGHGRTLEPAVVPDPRAGVMLGRFDPSRVTLEQVDEGLRALAAELTRRDLRLGQLGLDAERVGLAHRVGCPNVDTFYAEVLGVAPSSMAARIALARRVARLPRLGSAIEGGAIGFEAATLIGRVAYPATIGDWLALAHGSTVKQLREAIEAAELHARLDGSALDRLQVPTPIELEDARAFESAALSAAFVPTGDELGPMSGDADGLVDHESDLGTVPLRLTLPEDLAAMWRDLEVLLAEVDPEADLAPFLTQTTLSSWRGAVPRVAYHDIYLRDRYRCQNPACRARNVTPHHIVFRAHGGSEDPSNLVALCDACHLRLVHGGHLRVTGEAPAGLTWGARGFELR